MVASLTKSSAIVASPIASLPCRTSLASLAPSGFRVLEKQSVRPIHSGTIGPQLRHMANDPSLPPTEIIQRTRHWLEAAVIGLQLCPFASPVYRRNLVHFAVSQALSETDLETDLRHELIRLRDSPPEIIETTLLIHPWVLQKFPDYNQFLDVADALLAELRLDGEVQIASFHPDYCFAGAPPDDITHYTNRSPYPTLHLLRETSVSQAVDSVSDAGASPEINMATLRRLGKSGWDELGIQA